MLTIQHSEILTEVIGSAKALARDNRHTGYGAVHLLHAVMGKQSGLPAMLQAWEKDPEYFREWAEMRLENYPQADHPVDFLVGDESVDRVMEEAEKVRLPVGNGPGRANLSAGFAAHSRSGLVKTPIANATPE